MMDELSLARMNRTFNEIAMKLFHPLKIDFNNLSEKVKLASKEIGLPEIQIYSVDNYLINYAPVCAIIREKSDPAPLQKDNTIDIGYFIRSLSGSLSDYFIYDKNKNVISVDYNAIESNTYLSVNSVYINSGVFSAVKSVLFLKALEKQGLLANKYVHESLIYVSKEKELSAYQQRVLRYI